MLLENVVSRDVGNDGGQDTAVTLRQGYIATWQLCVASDAHQINLLHLTTAYLITNPYHSNPETLLLPLPVMQLSLFNK